MLTSNQKKFIRILKELGIYKRWLGNKRDYDRMVMNFNDTHPNVSQKLPDSPYFSFMIARSFIWDQTKERNMWDRLHGMTATAMRSSTEDIRPYCFTSTFGCTLVSLTHDEILDSDTIMKDLKQIVDEELHG